MVVEAEEVVEGVVVGEVVEVEEVIEVVEVELVVVVLVHCPGIREPLIGMLFLGSLDQLVLDDNATTWASYHGHLVHLGSLGLPFRV